VGLPNRQARIEPLKAMHGDKHHRNVLDMANFCNSREVGGAGLCQTAAVPQDIIGGDGLHRLVDTTRVWHSAARTPKTRTMPLQVVIRHCGTVCIPATGHDLDPLILADPTSCRTTGGPAMSAGASGFFVRLAGCHVSLNVRCRCRTTQHSATPQQRAGRQGDGLRDNGQHRRHGRDRSR
jgi:hypothetical protein